jgi:hypothetical protein
MLDGHVYIIGFEDGHVKVGASKNPLNRIKAIERQSGRIKNYDWVSPHIFDAIRLERSIHRRLNNHKAHPIVKEWFIFSPSIAVSIAQELMPSWELFSKNGEERRISSDPRYHSHRAIRAQIDALGSALTQFMAYSPPHDSIQTACD